MGPIYADKPRKNKESRRQKIEVWYVATTRWVESTWHKHSNLFSDSDDKHVTFRLSVDVCEFDPKDKSMMIEEITENENTQSDGFFLTFLEFKKARPRFELGISSLLVRRFNQLSHRAAKNLLD